MELSVMITESLRLCGIPVVILDVGVQDKIVNNTGEIDPTWFTPMAKGGTPIGEVCLTIREKDSNSMLIIVTDGQPDSFEKLQTALRCFPGDNIAFVIGDSYVNYASYIKNAVLAEPNTILHDLKAFVEKGGRI
jgi:hypothetical protein